MFSLLSLSGAGSLDDVVFEGRNRAYGAFQLRRAYHSATWVWPFS